MLAGFGQPGRTAAIVQTMLETIYGITLLTSLLSFGAVYPLPLSFCTLLAAVTVIAAGLSKGEPAHAVFAFRIGLWLTAILFVWIGLQVVPLPGELFAAAAWRDATDHGIAVSPVISIAPGETVAAVQTLALPVLMFLAGLMIFDTDANALRAFRRYAMAGGVLAVFGLLQFSLFPESLLLSEKLYYRDSLSLVFVNRNTAATLLGLVALMLFALFRAELAGVDRRKILAWALNGVPLGNALKIRKLAPPLCLFLATVSALFLTKSRGGAAATLLAFMLLFVLLSIFQNEAGRRRKAGFASRSESGLSKFLQIAGAIGALILVVAFLGQRTILRAEVSGTDDERICMLEGLVSAASSNALTGNGFGAFALTIPPYRNVTCGIFGAWDRAHNVFIEGFIGLGMMFIPVLLLAIAGLVYGYWIGIRERRSLRVYPMLGLVGLCLVLLHGLVDFSLQIPGFAAAYAAFAALTLSISLGRRDTRASAAISNVTTKRPRLPALHGLVLACVCAVSGAIAVRESRTVIANWDILDLAQRFERRTGPVSPQSLSILADRVSLDDGICRADVVRSSVTVILADLDQRDQLEDYPLWERRFIAAERYLQHALSCLPTDGNLWLRYAMVRKIAGENPQEQAQLMTMSQLLAPAEASTLMARMTHWNGLSGEALALARPAVDSDLRTTLLRLPLRLIKQALGTMGPALTAILPETVALLPPQRRALLEREGIIPKQDAEPDESALTAH